MSSRDEIIRRLRAESDAGRPVIGAGAGTGISAKAAELGGVDLIIIYNSGRYRMAGRGSLAGLLPFGDANAVVVDMAREVLPVVQDVPVLAGVCGTDPFRDMPRFLRELRELGFAGVQNFPTVGLYDGRFRQAIEETGMGYEHEVALISQAGEADLLSAAYVFSAEDAVRMVSAGADIVVAHMGLTTSGQIGAKSSITLEEAVTLMQEICDAAKEVNPAVIVLGHGGPLAEPSDVEYLFERVAGIAGFFGASSMERLPTETAIAATARDFKSLSLTHRGREVSATPPAS